MGNYTDMCDLVQHDNPNSIMRKGNKYDLASDPEYIEIITNNLWYTFNEDSEQNSYLGCRTPSYLVNRSLDHVFENRVRLLLRIKLTNFIIESAAKRKTITDLDGLTDFNIDSTFVLYYQPSSGASQKSFIMNFLKGVRNSFAHGGFNKLLINQKYNRVFLADNDIYGTKGFQLSLRIISDNNTDILQSAISNILLLNNPTINSLFNDNLLLEFNNLMNNSFRLEAASREENNGNMEKYFFYLQNRRGVIYELKAADYDEIKESIFKKVIKSKFKFNENKKIEYSAFDSTKDELIILFGYSNKFSIDVIKKYCIERIIGEFYNKDASTLSDQEKVDLRESFKFKVFKYSQFEEIVEELKK